MSCDFVFNPMSSLLLVSLFFVCFSGGPRGTGGGPEAFPFPPWTRRLFPRAAGSSMVYVGWGGRWDRVGPSLELGSRGLQT